jgi:hypothetical protein
VDLAGRRRRRRSARQGNELRFNQRCASAQTLEPAGFFEGVVATIADDDVVEDIHAEQRAGIDAWAMRSLASVRRRASLELPRKRCLASTSNPTRSSKLNYKTEDTSTCPRSSGDAPSIPESPLGDVSVVVRRPTSVLSTSYVIRRYVAARSRRVTANTAVEMTPLWKSQDDFHRRLQISQRTRDSHIPTPNF